MHNIKNSTTDIPLAIQSTHSPTGSLLLISSSFTNVHSSSINNRHTHLRFVYIYVHHHHIVLLTPDDDDVWWKTPIADALPSLVMSAVASITTIAPSSSSSVVRLIRLRPSATSLLLLYHPPYTNNHQSKEVL